MIKHFLCSLVLGLVSSTVIAADNDPGYGPRPDSDSRPVAGFRRGDRGAKVGYLRPTQRYYGNGYVVAYRYVNWNDRIRAAESTSFQGNTFNLPTNAAASVVGGSPRVTRFYANSKRSSVSSETTKTKKTTTTATTEDAPVKPVPPIAQ